MSQKNLSLFIDGHCFDQEYQGTHVYIRELYAALSHLYPGITLYAGARDKERLGRALPFIPKHHLLSYHSRGPGIVRYLTDIPRLMKQHQFNFAHFQYLSPPRSRKLKTQYIVTLHDILFRDLPSEFPWFYRMGRDRLFKNSIAKADIKTTVSHYSQQRIAHHYQVPKGRIYVIPSGVHPGFGSSISREAAIDLIRKEYGAENFILYVSRIEPRKNQQLLLRAWLSLRLYREGIPLIFIGKNSIRNSAFLELMAEMNEEERPWVQWHEQVPPHQLEAFYRACRLFVYPSKGEGFGLPPIEAALCGADVLCSEATAMQDFNFFSSSCFNPSSEKELIKLIRARIDQPDAKEEKEKIRACILRQYNWERNAQKFYGLLQQHA